MTGFGNFDVLCAQTPSYPWCNLFYRQILKNQPTLFTGASASTSSAPVGVNPECGTLLAGSDHSLGNIANIIACALSMVFCAGLVVLAGRRKAAVGRTELRIFLALYTLSLPFQLITTGSFLQQGSTPLVVITGIHAGIVAALFWALLANGIVATQVVEDGSASSIIPFTAISVVFFAATTYIALDTGMHFTHVFGPSSPLITLHVLLMKTLIFSSTFFRFEPLI
ncbi:hypothetical protein FIBSPDRAFT_1015770 [Athelia psychrophila]|uniref:Uncharacterized protein n=1 Tax=Athelia psychrophila TaxID=1759441 RepID=A0A167U5K6_9AGAM|nr:hypothetical protein FIBSPDRAFT_1015770 [Fibularhizoctonia sp. CBS 109695]